MEIGVFERKTDKEKQKNPIIGKITENIKKINVDKVIPGILLVLAARVSVMGGLMPFGVAMLASIGELSYFGSIVTVLAVFLDGYNAYTAIKYAAAIALYYSLTFNIGKPITKSAIRRGICMSASVILATLFVNIGSGLLMYDVFMMMLEAIAVFISVYMFSSALKTIVMMRQNECVRENDILPLAWITGIAVLGCSGILDYGYVSLGGVLCVLAALVFAHGGGVQMAAAAGTVIGLIAGLGDGNSAYVLGAFAFSSLVAGFFSRYGKAATVLSFVLANSVITFYTNDSAEILISIYNIIIAAVVFSLLPKRIFAILEAKEGNGRDYSSRVRGLIENELSAASAAFYDLSETFKNISDNKNILTSGTATSFIEMAAQKTCEGCLLSEHCWEKEFHRTYTAFFVLLEICEKKGNVKVSDIPGVLYGRCRKSGTLINAFNNAYGIYRVDKLWSSRACEGRAMIARHFAGISKRVNKLAKEIKRGATFDYDAENEIMAELATRNIHTKDVTVISRLNGEKTVFIKFKDDAAIDTKEVCKVAGQVMCEEMTEVYEIGKMLRLESRQEFAISVGSAGIKKENSSQSGDSLGYMNLEDGGFLLALSDGMGSGQRAAEDSRATISILKKLLGAGFDATTSINLVNSVLVLKSAETRFATIDLALVDLRKNEIKFYKVGAAPGYIKRGDDVCKIESINLPAGVSEKADVECKKIKICRGDMIVIISDGIADADGRETKCDWISEFLSDYKGNEPEELASRIVEIAKRKSGGVARDDMSVIVAHIS